MFSHSYRYFSKFYCFRSITSTVRGRYQICHPDIFRYCQTKSETHPFAFYRQRDRQDYGIFYPGSATVVSLTNHYHMTVFQCTASTCAACDVDSSLPSRSAAALLTSTLHMVGLVFRLDKIFCLVEISNFLFC